MKKGFTLIEGIIVVFVLSLVALAIMTAYIGVYKSIDLAKAKITAVSIANEKMEILRNMPYDSLATVHGPILPQGSILDDETVTSSGKTFNVHTDIKYVDDPFDGLLPIDIYPYDYKKAEITVTSTKYNTRLAQLSTNIAAKAAETPSNTGIIKICVIDVANLPVVGATITITNTTLTPTVNVTTTTGSDGCVMVPKLPPDNNNNYHLTATKDGYSTDMTYPRTAQNPNEPLADVDVYAQQVTSQTFVIDRLANLTLHFSNPVTFTLQGSKKMYFNPVTYKYSQTFTTDSGGNITLNNLEFDNYRIINTSSPYFVVTTSPLRSVNVEGLWYFYLAPAANLTVQVNLASTGSNPSIYNYLPLSGQVGSTVNIAVNGGNIQNNASIKLHKTIMTYVGSTQVPQDIEIVGTNITVTPQNQIIADFNLTGAELGSWDLIITNPNTESVIQTNGFEVTN
ncbi:MAG: carboxypeptidase regulatory-like domain-containing protein [Patescibacteria group bacterium]|nr:carboxypeptidase regulatory-like domain-containing protein [Patescibacteria group bacterium]